MVPEPGTAPGAGTGHGGVESTTVLLGRARDGDARAREELVRRLLPRLRRWAHGRLPQYARDLSDTDDLVQVSLLKALDHVSEFEPRREGAFLAYLRRIVLNAVRDELRRAGRRPAQTDLGESLPQPGPSLVERAIGREVVEAYEAALATLPEEQREAVVEGLEQLHALSVAFAAAEPVDRPGQQPPLLGRWGHLELVARLGEGSFGEVFRARDPNLDREVALKLRRAGPGSAGDSGRRLLEEARRLARIRHPNVVSVHGADLVDGRVGIWTELVEGQILEERLALDGPFSPGEAVSVGLDLCRALAAVHASGLVHGDVKAANVLRERGGRIVLTDLGSATEAGTPAVTGSPLSLAPEVLEGGPSTPSADLYSLGVLLFRLLTGRYPMDLAEAESPRDAQRRGRRVSLRDLRPDLQLDLVQVVERAADPDPEQRFPSAGAMEQALARLGGAVPAAALTPARQHRVVIAALAATAALVTVGVLAVRTATRPVEPPRPQAEQSHPGKTAFTEPAGLPALHPAPLTEVAPAAAPLPSPLEVAATMFRAGEGGGEALAEGARVTPGDRLYLEVEAAETVHVWVVNEDLDGNLFLLFPIAGLDLANPLPANRAHRLPGRLAGVPQEWQVTSAGGRERFLVIAARDHLPEVERELAAVVAANPAREGVDRGVGALRPAPAAGSGRLDALVEHLTAGAPQDGSVWLMRLELANP